MLVLLILVAAAVAVSGALLRTIGKDGYGRRPYRADYDSRRSS